MRDPTENDVNPKQGSEDPNNCPLDYVETRKKIRSFRGLVPKLQRNAESFRVYHSPVLENGAELTEASVEHCESVVSGSIEHMKTLEWIAKLIRVVKTAKVPAQRIKARPQANQLNSKLINLKILRTLTLTCA